MNGGGNCNGGNFGTAADYIVASALMTDASYPYKSGSLGCGFGGIMGSDDFCVPREMGQSHHALLHIHYTWSGCLLVRYSLEGLNSVVSDCSAIICCLYTD